MKIRVNRDQIKHASGLIPEIVIEVFDGVTVRIREFPLDPGGEVIQVVVSPANHQPSITNMEEEASVTFIGDTEKLEYLTNKRYRILGEPRIPEKDIGR